MAWQAANETHVTVNVAGPQIKYQDKTGHSLLLRAIWFVFVGCWFGQVWLLTAWIFNVTIIGLPLGLLMVNKLPGVMTLRSRSEQLTLSTDSDGSYVLTKQHLDQRPFWLRALYFIFVGWGVSLLWAEAAYIFALLIVTIPLSFVMFDRLPAVTTLARY